MLLACQFHESRHVFSRFTLSRFDKKRRFAQLKVSIGNVVSFETLSESNCKSMSNQRCATNARFQSSIERFDHAVTETHRQQLSLSID